MNRGREPDAVRILRALSVETRVAIIRLLGKRTLCVGALSNLLRISAGAVSQHLRILKDAGLVEPDRRGYFVHYSLAPDAERRCRAIMDALFENKTGSAGGGGKCVAEKRNARGRKR
ncbi:MAG: metalloregulator ArsR/SmtB family transcription factor [Kiritimatiellae bacterium]|nr:metalloregulator ArsR/SmtB family transcription factor [Kiritimatiellia bacterium]